MILPMVASDKAQGSQLCRKLVFYIVFYNSLGGHRVGTVVLGYIYTHQNNYFH